MTTGSQAPGEVNQEEPKKVEMEEEKAPDRRQEFGVVGGKR